MNEEDAFKYLEWAAALLRDNIMNGKLDKQRLYKLILDALEASYKFGKYD